MQCHSSECARHINKPIFSFAERSVNKENNFFCVVCETQIFIISCWLPRSLVHVIKKLNEKKNKFFSLLNEIELLDVQLLWILSISFINGTLQTLRYIGNHFAFFTLIRERENNIRGDWNARHSRQAYFVNGKKEKKLLKCVIRWSVHSVWNRFFYCNWKKICFKPWVDRKSEREWVRARKKWK